ncbi:MAG: aminotransferase class III-fold pyridoxal phosphate-dependent enzyme [Pseudomonadota bacterium]
MNTLANTPTPEDLTAWDRDHHLHPWAGVEGFKRDEYMRVGSGEGVYLWDDTGKRFIDGPGGMWCMNIGYGRKEMADAIAAQVLEMPFASPWSFTTGPAAQLAHEIAKRTPGDLNTVHFTCGGSTAVDTALRAVQFYNNRMGRPEKKIIISREKGYHGSTYLASSVTGKERFNTSFDKADFVRFLPDISPNIRPEGMSMSDWCDAKIADLEALIETEGADRIGAFICETILCSGGMVVPPEGYHRRALEICRRHDILYISDEVVTGFGRLGHWFASEPVFGIVPDIITCAKGLTSGYLPLGACIMSDALVERMAGGEAGSDTFYNGYTYSAHPVSCVAGLKNIEIMEREDILGHVQRLTPHFQGRLHQIGDAYDIVGDVRGMGFLGCLECTPEYGQQTFEKDMKFGDSLDRVCEEHGLILRPFGNMAVFSPPLVMSEAEIDQMFDIMEIGLTKMTEQYNG